MKKSTLLMNVAGLAASISALVAMSASAQTMTYRTAADINDSNPVDHIVAARRELDKTNYLVNELLRLIESEHVGDPISMDSFDVDTIGAKLLAAGLIGNVNDWHDIASIIQAKGFPAYLEELKVQLSNFDKHLGLMEQPLSTWTKLDSDARMAAIEGNTSDNILPQMIRFNAATAKFTAFAHMGLVALAELSYLDMDKSLVESERQTVVAA
jgi:hypothetical protein